MDNFDEKKINSIIIKIDSVRETLSSLIREQPVTANVAPIQFSHIIRELNDALQAKDLWKKEEIIELVIECIQMVIPVHLNINKPSKQIGG